MKLLLDENISPLVAEALRLEGYDALHVRETGLKGRADQEILTFAKKEGRALVTLDADFADVRRFPLGSHTGIIRLRLSFAPSAAVVKCLKRLLPRLRDLPLSKGALVTSDCREYRVRLP